MPGKGDRGRESVQGAEFRDVDQDQEQWDSDGQEGAGLGRRVEDAFRKVVLTGVGAVFMTEENIRNLVRELKLPRDMAQYLIGQTERTKNELTSVLAREVGKFLNSDQVYRELRKLLAGMELEVTARVKIIDPGEGPDSDADAGADMASESLQIKTRVMPLSEDEG